MKTHSDEYAEINKLRLHRLIFFTDAVLAIIITLLVIELHLPELTDPGSGHEMTEKLMHMLPHFGAFVLCFFTLAQGWVGYNILFSVVNRYDNTLGLLNVFSLLPSCLLPFAASLIGSYFENPVSFVFLGSVSFLSSMGQYFINRYLLKNKMFSPIVDLKKFEKLMKNAIAFPVVSLLMGLAAYIDTRLSFTLFMLTILSSIWSLRKMKITISSE